jgi:hypothetical protein
MYEALHTQLSSMSTNEQRALTAGLLDIMSCMPSLFRGCLNMQLHGPHCKAANCEDESPLNRHSVQSASADGCARHPQ